MLHTATMTLQFINSFIKDNLYDNAMYRVDLRNAKTGEVWEVATGNYSDIVDGTYEKVIKDVYLDQYYKPYQE